MPRPGSVIIILTQPINTKIEKHEKCKENIPQLHAHLRHRFLHWTLSF